MKEAVIVATISGRTVLITGEIVASAPRWSQALRRGARRVYVGTRKALAGNGDSA